MTDRQLARAFERGEVASGDFHHREHLRLAWAYLRESPSVEVACERMRAAIRSFAAAAGHPGKYHETLTVFWVRLLAGVRERQAQDTELDAILAAHPYLLDKKTPHAWYSPERLMGEDARRTWQPPDLRPTGFGALAPERAGDDRRVA